MRRVATTTTATLLTFLAGLATAQGIENGQITGEVFFYDQGSDENATFATVAADAIYRIQPGIGVQGGIGFWTQPGATQDFLEEDGAYFATAHGYYDYDAKTRLGGLLGYEDGRDGLFFGGEAIRIEDVFRLEARYGWFGGDDGPETLLEGFASYTDFAPITVGVSYQTISFDTDALESFTYSAIRGSYDITDTLTGYAEYGVTTIEETDEDDTDGSQYAIGVTYAAQGTKNPKLFNYSPLF